MAEKIKEEEKFYTPEEVAIAVLKKAQELLRNSSLFKANSSHEVENGEEPNNDDAECPPSLEEADIENSGAHGEKKSKKGKAKSGIEGADVDGDGDVDGDDAMSMADKDGDGDVDGDDAVEAKEEESGKDIDGDDEAGEPEEHKEKIKAAAKSPKKEEKDPKEKVADASEGKKKPAFMKAEDCAPEMDLKKPSLKKFMLRRKMKKSGVPTSDARAAEKLSGAPPAPAPAEKIKEPMPSPAEKVKAQPKMQMEKNKATEKLMGIKPKAGK